MRRLSIVTLVLFVSCSGFNSKDELFEALYHRTFIPKEGVTIEFVDSTSYIRQWGQDSSRKTKREVWSIERRLTGTYLFMNGSGMRLETLSDSLIIFSKGEFSPRFEVKN